MSDDFRDLSRWTPRQVVVATLFIVTVGLTFWSLYRFRLVVFIFFVAVVLGTAIRPAVRWLNERGISRALGVALVYFLLLVLVVVFVLLVAPLIVQQVSELSVTIPRYYGSLRQVLLNSPSQFLHQVGVEMPVQLYLSSVTVAGEGQSLDTVTRFLSYVSAIGRSLIVIVAILLVGFYWTLESERVIRSILLLLPGPRRDSLRELLLAVENRLGGYIRGQTLLCVVIGVLSFVAYLLIGLPYALVLAIIAGVLEAVPIVGPTLGAIPAILVALSGGVTTAVWTAVAAALIQLLENHLLVPRIMGRSAGVNSIVSLLALATFGSLLGLPGALLAIPVAAIIQLLLERLIFSEEDRPLSELEGRDCLSVLRYEAQNLAQDVRKQLRKKDVRAEDGSDSIEEQIETIAVQLDRLMLQSAHREDDL